MKRNQSGYADGSCWISGDRVNACISARVHAITEFGFHGLQPVSRNSRMLVHPAGMLTCALREISGDETPFEFSSVDWEPRRITGIATFHEGIVEYEILAARRALHVFVRGNCADGQLVVRFPLDACFSDVRGERTWDAPAKHAERLVLCSRDRIELGPWMKITGPYAGDFLIPEQWRRLIFSKPIRSGLATRDDLRPEYRDSSLTIYDARTWIVLEGCSGTVELKDDIATFVIPAEQLSPDLPAFSIRGSETNPSNTDADGLDLSAIEQLRRDAASLAQSSPVLKCAALPGLSAFMGTAPALVSSATVRDVGMTRATPGAYYWLWAWDNLVTGQEALRWGAHDLAGSIVRYVNVHRDIDGRIPARWTRADEPMDTPPHGALEFLLLHLAYEHALATGDTRDLLSVYPNAVAHLNRVLADHHDGLVQGLSFYPDRPVAFGRSVKSVVALEVGCLYSFSRLLDNVAVWLGDAAVAGKSRLLAREIENAFAAKFWDEQTGFIVDSFDAMSGIRNASYPLFSLLFLQSTLGLPLVRGHLSAMSRFLDGRLLTNVGTRMLPQRDERRSGEDALGSWYPHWDIYLLKLCRRAGRTQAIERWAANAERVLERLGYVPEFVVLDGLTADPGPAWLHHGAVSNLNCVTGWYRCVVEALCGIELDPGGMSVVPLGLGIGPVLLRGLNVRGTLWDIAVQHEGEHLQEIRVDGEALTGCLKVPARFQDRRSHELVIRYGKPPSVPVILEASNAEVLDSHQRGGHTELRIRSLGMTDVVIDLAERVQCQLDGNVVNIERDVEPGRGTVRILEAGVHELVFR
jgi:hypothetical protein